MLRGINAVLMGSMGVDFGHEMLSAG